MIRLRNRFNGGIVKLDEEFAAQLDPTMWEPVEEKDDKPSPKPAARRGRKKAEDDSGNADS